MVSVGIFGAPRSGTSWLGQIFNSSPAVAYRFQPLFSFALKGRLSGSNSPEQIQEFNNDLLITKDDFILQKKNINGNEIADFPKKSISHLVWKEVRYHYIIKNLLNNSSTKIVGIVRHPCAVINSWLQAPKEFSSSWNPKEEWRNAEKKNAGKLEEYNGYEKWKELAFLYKQLASEFPNKFYIIKYEDLNTKSEFEVRKLFDFVNLEWNKQTEDFIRMSKETNSDDPYGVYRANQENYKWKNELDLEIAGAILTDKDYLDLNKYYKWSI